MILVEGTGPPHIHSYVLTTARPWRNLFARRWYIRCWTCDLVDEYDRETAARAVLRTLQAEQRSWFPSSSVRLVDPNAPD